MLAADIKFAQKVGVAPSTTTMVLPSSRPGLGIACYPVPSVAERNAWIARSGAALTPGNASPLVPGKAAAPVALNPYASEVDMRGIAAGGIGLVDPNDAWYTGDVARVRAHGTTTILFNPKPGGGYTSQLLGGLGITSGEINRSLTGALGTIPNDDELARNLCYTPVHSGWIYGQKPTGENFYVDGFYGADGDTPIYKKAGFWLAIAGGAAVIGGGAYALTRKKRRRRRRR